MRKYLYSFKLYFLTSFQYRFDMVINLLMSNVQLLVTLVFWIIIFQSNHEGMINGYSMTDMITFFVASSLFRVFVLNRGGYEIVRLIKSGDLSKVLIKPYGLNLFLYCKNLSGSLFEFFRQFAFLLLVIPFFAGYFTWKISIYSFLVLLLFLAVSSVISHLLWNLLGMMAFWLEEATAVMWSFSVILNLLSGMFIPLDFFPDWSVSMLELMPFAAFTYIPAKIYMNQLPAEKVTILLIVYGFWILALTAVNSAVWKTGVRKYSAIGG